MNVLSLFDGISAARVALDRAGIKINRYYASEIKPHAVKIARAMFPDTIQLGDITKIDFSVLPKIDFIVFGSPCQDLSCANSEQKGLAGERSGLFYKAVEAIRICKPRWFLMENVTSMKPSERTKISRALGEFYTNDFLGMYCEPVRINSSLVSAQMRDRLYWCNWGINQPKDKGIVLQDILEQEEQAFEEKSYALLSHYSKGSWVSGAYGGQGGSLIGIKGQSSYFGHDKSYALTTSYGKKAGIADHAQNCAELIKIGNIKNDSISCRVYSPEGKATSQNANGGGQGAKTGLYKIGENVRKLIPRECCRLQTYDERIFDLFTMNREEATPEKPYMSKSAFYNVFGDSFTVDVIVHILRCNKEMAS
jgi:DNA (cytosine-5)-methyltransferase 3A